MLSVGAGRGILEEELMKVGFKVKAIEIDESFVRELRSKGIDAF